LTVVGIVIIGFIVLQFVGTFVPLFARTNPPVTFQINWDSPETERLMRAACYDCHSHETVWPWYSNIAPISWLVAKDVNEARRAMNLSTGRGEIEAEEMIEQIERGDMPLPIYVIMHPEANLSEAQKQALIAGIQASLGRGQDN
jgi:cytochrome c551/c552